MRVQITPEVPEGQLFGDSGPGPNDAGECYSLQIEGEHIFATCIFDEWPGIWRLELGWLLHENEEGMTTYV